MKKLCIVFLALALIFCSGCNGYKEIERGYFVTAVGFKIGDNGIKILLEALSPSADEQKRCVLSGEGKDLSDAYRELQKSLVKKPYFEHCGVIMLENGLKQSDILNILNFCAENISLNIGVYLVGAQNITEILKTPSLSDSVGYDIISLIKNSKDKSYSNKLYQIKRQTEEHKIYDLPLISLENERLILE